MPDPTLVESQSELEERAPDNIGSGSHFQRNPQTKWFLVIAVIVVLAIVAGLWHYYSARESTDDAEIDGHIIPISPKVGGTVLAVNVKDNQYVEAGTLLVQIDPADYRIALERAQADWADAQAMARAAGASVPIESTTTGSQLSTAQANVQNAAAGVAVAGKEIEVSKAKLNSAQARLREALANETKAAKDLDRMKQLVAKDEISEQQYDAAIAAEASTHAAVESSRAAVTEAEQGVQVAESRLTQARSMTAEAQASARSAQTAPQQVAVIKDRAAAAEARAQQAKAAVDQAQLNLQYATMTAPVSGVVSKKSVEAGQVIQAGEPILAIVPLQDIWVTANFKETQLRHMRVGQPATISVDAFGGRKFKGHVDSIAAATGAKFSLLPPENASGNYVKVVQRVPVKIVFEKGEDPQHLLRPGMSVNPTVYVK
ncbi:MAG TPA: HlyD family secretion protein [Terriglobia bacterium]|nr:HlyD family secretion protein [Terriglobia bacterium]